ncbi:RNA polymerase sigma factor, partial [Vallitalea sp.]|uniref:RNA polymerase sigma factor n=1 Tax=Vallitalea sp. TaxID=1882829 RepID=UPI0025D02C95
NISYINKSIKNTYIRFSKSNNKKLNIIPLNESFHNQADETIAYINEAINQLSRIQRRIIIYKIHGYSDVEIALKLKASRQTVSRHKKKGIQFIKDYLK